MGSMSRRTSKQAAGPHPTGPRAAELFRLGAVVVLELAAGIFCLARGWTAFGVVLCALGVATAASAWLVATSLARFALGARPRSSQDQDTAGKVPVPRKVGVLEAVFGAHGMIGSRQGEKPVETPPPTEEEAAVERQVGSMLRRSSAVEARFSELLEPGQRARVQQARMAERGLTHLWLQAAPPWQEVSVASDDGAFLTGRAMAVDPGSNRWVILVHGYAGRWHEMILYARHWALQGYNLLLVEQRAHGRSQGRWRGLGYLERRDLVAWAQWLVGENGPAGPDARLVLHGHSMGAASVCMASAEPDLPPQVRAAISDSSFTSGWEACARLLGDGGLPEHPTLELMRAALRLQSDGYDIAQASALDAVHRPGPPVLFIHGAQDSLVPVADARALYGAAARPKGLLVIPGAGHCQACLADPVAYYGEAFAFTERYMVNG